MQSQKPWHNLGSFPRQTIQHHSNSSLFPIDVEEAEADQFYEDLWASLVAQMVKNLLAHRRPGTDSWVRKIPWRREKAKRVLPREHTGHSKHSLPKTQEITVHMDITRWSTLKSDWLYSLQPKMETLFKVSKNKARSWLWLRSWTPYCQIQT